MIGAQSSPFCAGPSQLQEEYIALLSLVDVELCYRTGNPDDERTCPLSGADSLLQAAIKTPKDRDEIKKKIRKELESIRDYNDTARSIVVNDAIKGSFIVDRGVTSVYELKFSNGSVRRRVSAPGIVIRVFKTALMRPHAIDLIRMDTVDAVSRRTSNEISNQEESRMPTATIQYIYCVSPSTGTDGEVNDALVNALGNLTNVIGPADLVGDPRVLLRNDPVLSPPSIEPGRTPTTST
ncbi:MAG: hypothetical protein JNK85_22585 [Verrucomicrobiales bacterium]|nr:hypothetical protein [Verrucomicrobiales bacterium]